MTELALFGTDLFGEVVRPKASGQDTGEVLACGALKTMLHEAADRLPRAQVMDS